MEPEIARRCKSCGAAIRARSAFCPQCGVAVTEGGAQPVSASAPSVAPDASQRKATDSRPSAETVASAAKAETPVQTEASVKTGTAAPEDVQGKNSVAPDSPVENQQLAATIAPEVGPANIAPEKKQRVAVATTAVRSVVDDGVRHRADKLRRASNVVLDEAAADPSLRFVLVATALIIISLLILLLARIL